MRNRYFARSLPGSFDQRPERLARGRDRELDVLGPGLRDLGERLLVARRDRREALPAAARATRRR